MAQLFKASTNSLAKISLMVFASLPVLAILVGMTLSRNAPNTRQMLPLEQPIPFSHRHHSIELGIDCRYCHTSVETGAQAGLPSTETCMSCHAHIWTNSPLLEPVRTSYAENKPIEWTQLNKVPEFVYFNHSVHINKGISCNQCHGAIQDMQIAYKARTLFMSWCLDCHRKPEKYLYTDPRNPQLSPKEQVFNLYQKYQADPGMSEMTLMEQQMLKGAEQHALSTTEGKELVKARGLKKEQLADCAVCHH